MLSRTLGFLFLVSSAGLSAGPAPAPLAVESFPPGDVKLLESPFLKNRDRNAEYLLSLSPDRFLHNTRLYCGLEPKGELYGGWESRGIAGHSLGHYLSALAEQYAATGDQRIKEKLDYTVAEMAECQKRYGDGYIGALPPKELAVLRGFRDGKIELEGGFNFQGGAWVPWYTEHKILAGLKDAWVLAGNRQAKEVALNMADWVDAVTAGLSPEQQQQMLRVEHGGMLETMADLYALTGEKRYLDASRRFYQHAIMDPLLAGKDELTGKHANTQIPKVIGEARSYEVGGDTNGRAIAEFFWNTVVTNRSWALGGNSDREHFFAPAEAAHHLGPETAETCNTYNMLKLTGHLMEWNPKSEYGDFYEKALYNHILASQEPEKGMFTYFLPLKPGHFRTYSTPDNSFWCCVGTGMENHTRYGEAIYFHGSNSLYVNLFIPSELTWKEQGVELVQETAYPEIGGTKLTFKTAPEKPLKLLVRCPGWMTSHASLALNGKPLLMAPSPGTFAEVERVWKAGDTLQVTLPMGLRIEPLSGDTNRVALFYGPLLLAGDLGPVEHSATIPWSGDHVANDHAPSIEVPVFVAKDTADVLSHLKCFPGPGPGIAFRSEGIGKPQEVTLRPFKDLFFNRYNVYWEVISPSRWEEIKAAREREVSLQREEAARLVDEVAPGEQQSETDHHLVAERSETGDFQNRKWRDARDGGFFEYRMKVLPGVPQSLRCTYWGDDAGNRTFDLLVGGKMIATQTLERNKPGQFLQVETPIPADLINGKQAVTVRLQAKPGKIAGGLFRLETRKAINHP